MRMVLMWTSVPGIQVLLRVRRHPHQCVGVSGEGFVRDEPGMAALGPKLK